ncbi:phytanoyl-CoA dioxygenase [Mycena vitilis]|nr:phytanoyl-CoA dioxygenase [Mycena vitilis]
MLERSKVLLQEFSLDDHPLFTTGDDNHVGDAYFLESGDKIRYFLEEDAVVDGKLTRPKELAVNKIGHGERVTLENNRIRALVRDLQFHRDPVGSHLTTPITKRFVRLPAGGTGFEPLVTPDVAEQVAAHSKNSSDSYVLETCDLVLIHGAVLHKSERNRSQKTRFAYTFHMIESSPGTKYDEKNWLQPTSQMPFSRILA